MQIKQTRVVIVGGGTAGWLTAGVIAAKHNCASSDAVSVTLIEAPNIQSIGVGEGTWPSMRATLKSMGISESDFIRQCDVSFKQGSKFVGWHHGANEVYYHPFTKPVGAGDINLSLHWQQYRQQISFADAVCPQASFTDNGIAPKQISTPEYSFGLNYGYHLNAGKFGDFIRKHCINNLGVQHVLGEVTHIQNDQEDYVCGLQLADGKQIEGDIFVDCTGFKSLLLGEHYGVAFQSKKHILMNDTAIAAQVPYADTNSPIASFTTATAKQNGWTWDIGLSSRRGVGFVYSSAHTDQCAAEQTLLHHIHKTGGGDMSASDLRRIDINPGHRETFWHKNVVAIGLSAGFLEPLEASALVLAELSAKMLAEQLPTNRQMLAIISKRFNRTFLYRWQTIIDFLKLHYVLSERDDSDYWQDMRANANNSDNLNELLDLWQHQPPDSYDHLRVDEMFPAASYQYVLYGMNFKTHVSQQAQLQVETSRANQLFQQNKNELEKLKRALPTNRDLLNKIQQFGLSKI
ncbi:MAG: tryptophan halogenase family protein [Glaciecola sp.]